MSNKVENNMTPENAYDILVQQIHAPVFFEKLAKVYNIVPQTDDEAHYLVKLAGYLRHSYEQNNIKTAQARGNIYANMCNELASHLQHQGIVNPQHNEDDLLAKNAANILVANPIIKQAADAYNKAMTESVYNQTN